MPLPFLLLGAAAVMGCLGVGAAASASDKRREAESNFEEAEEVVEDAQAALMKAKDAATGALAKLGQRKLEMQSAILGEFVRVLEPIKSFVFDEMQDQEDVSRPEYSLTSGDLPEIESAAFSAEEALKAGAGGIGTGALVAVGAFSATKWLAVAGTGKAIATLSGVAATNATLAWLGGGTLTAGGMGVAGGMAVLGGAVAGPAILVMGWLMDSKASKRLEESRMALEQAEAAAEEMKAGAEVLRGIKKRSDEIHKVIDGLAIRLEAMTKSLALVVDNLPSRRSSLRKLAFWKSSHDPRLLTEGEVNALYIAKCTADVLHAMLNVPVLDESGAITAKSKELLKVASKHMKAIAEASA